MEDWKEAARAACAAVIDAVGDAEALRAAAAALWKAAAAYGATGGRPAVLEALGDAAWWAAAGAFDRADADLEVVRYEAAFESAVANWCEAAAGALERWIERHWRGSSRPDREGLMRQCGAV